MKRLKLNLDQLGEELGILDPGYLQGIKGGYGNSSGSYGGYNSWQELWDAMQNGYLPPAGTYNPGGSGSYGGYGNYGGYSSYGGYNGGWPGWYPPGTGGGYGSGSYGSYGGYGGYGGYAGYGGPFPRITFNNLWNAYPRQNLHPSNDGYENQCAIRLGKALQDAFDIDFTDSSYTKFGPVTTEGYPRGAKSLADYLESNLPGVKK
ncbi:hypothetical protein [Arcticibacter tournemirensis]|uniref:hypothetical protein n=1 Tax=Arcticibacter tournemirensis TaxID=699437 RepID=UPI00192A5127|nr:hypothetical protein [Arcticibacter tournemirensis]